MSDPNIPAHWWPVRFCFGDHDVSFHGFADGTTWNGFLNVWVTPEVHAKVRAHVGEESWVESGFADLPLENGLYSYANGFTTEEVE